MDGSFGLISRGFPLMLDFHGQTLVRRAYFAAEQKRAIRSQPWRLTTEGEAAPGGKKVDAWPHKETPLTEQERDAYRYLLYQAMLDVRTLCQSRGPISWNPMEWRRQYQRSRVAGSLADWLHNLAHYAAMNFRGFDTAWFWQEYDGVVRRCAQVGPGEWMDYRKRYEEQLARCRAS